MDKEAKDWYEERIKQLDKKLLDEVNKNKRIELKLEMLNCYQQLSPIKLKSC